MFLGMDITFNNNDGTFTILMKEYLKDAIADSGMDASMVAPTPAKKDLYTVGNGFGQLDKRQCEIFHSILMKEYLKEAIADSGMDASKVAPTPAKKDLFIVDDVSAQLDNAKLLYVSKGARTDAQLAIAFLCTRVSCSTKQDWNELIQLLQYFNGTLDMPLIRGADSLAKSKSWVDAAYAVHDDMKSHTGGATSLGRGAIMCKSTKQTEHKEFY